MTYLDEEPSIIRPGVVRVNYPFGKYVRITSPFGKLRSLKINDQMVSRIHNGIDFGCGEWTGIKAVADGRVFRAGWQDETDRKLGYGLRIWQEAEIDDKKFYIWYGHMSWCAKEEGDDIKIGEYIGLSGNTGASTGPHLHLGMREKNTSKFYNMEFFNIPTEGSDVNTN